LLDSLLQEKMTRLIPMLLSMVIAVCAFIGTTKARQVSKDHHFDILILTQHWPYTTCTDWERGSGHECRDIAHANWSVHGLWPTQMGKIAPGFCNKTWKFEHKVLEPIMDEMNLYWPDVEMRDVPDSLWKHEWEKHGTCAAQLSETSTELAYFSKGVELSKENKVTEWLKKGGVVPSDDASYSMETVWDAVLNGTKGYRPHIDCKSIDGKAFINEIKVCYTKNFTRVNCDGIKATEGGDMMGTCLRYDSFSYPASVPPPSHLSNSGMIGGVVCTVLALSAVALAVGYMLYRRSRRRGRGYESL